MGKLYIRGDMFRGNDVISLFEMLYPGSNKEDLAGNNRNSAYYIKKNGCLGYKRISDLEEAEEVYAFGTLIKKYPYRIGDKVIHDWGG